MQTKNQNRKYENYPSPMIEQSIIIRSKKVKQGDEEQTRTISPG